MQHFESVVTLGLFQVLGSTLKFLECIYIKTLVDLIGL